MSGCTPGLSEKAHLVQKQLVYYLLLPSSLRSACLIVEFLNHIHCSSPISHIIQMFFFVVFLMKNSVAQSLVLLSVLTGKGSSYNSFQHGSDFSCTM